MNPVRRKFLRLLLISGGVLIFVKFFGSKLFSFLSSLFGQQEDFSEKGTSVKMLGEDFKVLESENKLVFFNKKGEEIFSIDQEGAIEIGP
jgi:hypothetical protein